MTTGVIVGGSNVTSNMNTRRRHFLHFGMIGANPFRGFRAFGGNNNNSSLRNNNNNNLSLLLLPRFRRGLEGGLGGGFNLLPGENVKELDPNVAALVNALTRSEEHTSELQSRPHLVCRLLLEKKKPTTKDLLKLKRQKKKYNIK